jgi:hypothetical protein
MRVAHVTDIQPQRSPERPSEPPKPGFFKKHGITLITGVTLVFGSLGAFGGLTTGIKNLTELFRSPTEAVQSNTSAKGDKGVASFDTRFALDAVSERIYAEALLQELRMGVIVSMTHTVQSKFPDFRPEDIAYGVEYIEQGDGDGQVRVAWHLCPADLSHVLLGIRKQCLASPTYRRKHPLRTADLQ